MKDYRIKITIRNDRLLSAIEDKGVPSVNQFCKLYKIDYMKVCHIISGKLKPLNDKGYPTKIVEKLLDILDISLEDAFTERQLKGFNKSSYQISVSENDVKQLVNPIRNHEEKLIEQDVKLSLHEAFSKRLNAREEKILRMHYGFDGGKEHSKIELANIFNISRSRVDQIIAKAERKLKHPSVSNNIINTGFTEIYKGVIVNKDLLKRANENQQTKEQEKCM
jgi:RNA polymerase sigma factor (sigma-70 family)